MTTLTAILLMKDHFGCHQYGHFMKVIMANIGIILKGGKSVFQEKKRFVRRLFLLKVMAIMNYGQK